MADPERLPVDVCAAIAAGGGFSTRRVLAHLGVTRAELDAWCRARLLERVTRGVYAEPLGDVPRERHYERLVRAVLLARAGRSLAVTGPAALVLHGLPVLGASPTVVHALAPHEHGNRCGDRVKVVGPAGADEVTFCGEQPAATPTRAVLDCVRVFGVAAAVAAADAALRADLTTEALLAVTANRMRGTKGAARARRVVALADRRSESPGESWSAVVIDALGLPAPDRQHEVRDGDGLAGRVDFWWPGSGLAGEFDGRVKYGRQNPSGRAPEEVLWAEKRREDRMRAAGVMVVRWTTADLADPRRLFALLRPRM